MTPLLSRVFPKDDNTLSIVGKSSVILFSFYICGVALVAFAFRSESAYNIASVLSIAVLSGTASTVVGGFLGFLFGMPREFSTRTSIGTEERVSSTTDSQPANSTDSGLDATQKRSGQQASAWVNNNLIEVSDWLTKIVVGVGLIQFREISTWVGATGTQIGAAAGLSNQAAPSFGVSILLVNFGIGFLVTYLYSRTLLTMLFAAVTKSIDEQFSEKVGEIIKEQTARLQKDIRDVVRDAEGPASVIPLLYDDPPEGFATAIERARSLLEDDDYRGNARLWGYLACGLGQKYEWIKDHTPGSSELPSIAQEALEAVRQVVELDPRKRLWLRAFWDPTDEEYIKGEDDLKPFFDDPDLRKQFEILLR